MTASDPAASSDSSRNDVNHEHTPQLHVHPVATLCIVCIAVVAATALRFMSLEAAVRARGHALQVANTDASCTREQLSSFQHSDASKPIIAELVDDTDWAALVRCRERLEAIEAQL